MAAQISITINSSSAGSAIADAKKDVQELGETAEKSGGGFSALKEIGIGALREIGSAITNYAIGGLKSLAGAVSDGISDARENAKIQAQTAAVIKSTGNAAGVTAEQVADYASSLSAAAGQSLFGDDQIQQSENLLMTFTSIKGTALEAATAISVDMAQALGGAPKDSAIQLGKALNDPIKGITALTRVGVTFTDEQKNQIKTLQESGNMQAAQTIILEELNKEFGGSAAAAAAADGGWAQFNDRMGEAKEAIGTAILPLLGMLAGVLNDTIAPAIESVAATFGAWLSDPAVVAQLQAIGQAITTGIGMAFDFLANTAIPALIGAWHTLGPAIQPLIASFSDAKTPVQGLLDTLSQISPMFALARAGVEAAVGPIRDIILTTFGIISGFIAEHGEKIKADLTGAWQQVHDIINAIIPPIQEIISSIFGAIATFLHAHGDDIKAFMASTWDGIASIVSLALQLIQATIVPALQFIAGFISSHGAEIQAILSVVWENIKGIINIAIAVVKGILQTALALIKGDWQGAWDAIKLMFSTVWENIKSVLNANLAIVKAVWETLWTGIKAFFEGILNGIVGFVIQSVVGIANAIRNFGTQAEGAAASLGDAIVSGISNGIKNGASAIVNAAKDAAMAALHAAESALGIGSPSKVMADGVGIPISQGIAQGIRAAGGGIITSLQGVLTPVASTVNALVQQPISTTLQNAKVTAADLAGKVGSSVIDSLSSQFGRVAATAEKSLANPLTGALKKAGESALTEGRGIGDNTVDGIAGSISAGSGAIKDAAKRAAQAALDAAKAALGISSPSRVFADQVGLPAAQGMAQGFASGAPLVVQAADYVASSALAGAASRTTHHNNQKTINYSPTYHNTPNPSSMESAILQSLAGV